jgi:hypothetical protein
MAMLSSRAERGICFLFFRNALIAVLSFNLLGHAWRDCFDRAPAPQLQVAHLSR